MNGRIAIALSIPLVLLACGEKVQRKNRAPDFFSPGVFSEKPANEVLSLKYNRALITCRLWSQQTSKLDVSGAPRDTKSVDLLRDANWPKSLSVAASLTNHEVTARIQFSEISIARFLDLKDPANGKAYIAQFTPVIAAEAHLDSSTAYKGRTSKTMNASVRAIYENVQGLMMSGSSLPSTGNGVVPYQDYVTCAIETDIKPEFKDQFLARDLK